MSADYSCYAELKYIMQTISHNMFEQVCKDMDSHETKLKYYFVLALDAFKGIELSCAAIDIQAYSQIATLLRQIVEQVAILKIIGKNDKALDKYIIFAKAKLARIADKNDKTLEELYNNRITPKKPKLMDYYTYGWLEALGETTIDVNSLLTNAQMDGLTSWHHHFNGFVHNSISFLNYNDEGKIITINRYIYLLARLMDELMCSYHNCASYNFVVDEHVNRNRFIVLTKTAIKLQEMEQ